MFGKQPGTTTGGPDPNDPKNKDKWKKVGKRWDEEGKKEEAGKGNEFSQVGPLASSAEPSPAFLQAMQKFGPTVENM